MKRYFLLILLFAFYSTSIFSQEMSKDSFNELLGKLIKEGDSINKASIGTQYMNFTAITLDNINISEKDLLGKVTLLNFWFEGCAPCVAEFKYLNELYLKYKETSVFQLISFTLDSAEDAKNTSIKHNIHYAIAPISREECSRLSLDNGFPTNIIIDKNGKIIYLKSGGPVIEEKVKKQIQLFEQEIVDELAR